MLNNLYNNTPIWQDIPKDIWNELISISTTLTFARNTTVIRDGQFSEGLCIVRKGILKVTHSDYKGDEQIIQFLGKNSIFGYEELITNQRYYNAVVSITKCEIEIISKDTFLRSIHNSIRLMSAFITYTAINNQILFYKLIYFERKPLLQRLALTLILLNISLNLDEEIPFKRRDITNYLGTSPEAHSRQLKVLKSSNIISSAGRKINIIDVKKLYDIINQ